MGIAYYDAASTRMSRIMLATAISFPEGKSQYYWKLQARARVSRSLNGGASVMPVAAIPRHFPDFMMLMSMLKIMMATGTSGSGGRLPRPRSLNLRKVHTPMRQKEALLGHCGRRNEACRRVSLSRTKST